ncbi:coatomer protein alpha subunit [Radiomyces spectabilis]|uniref:coatomer protein alpha subunit n=1 Tax=Radiomyces spectabilis TaxID=64574 RepID=UPI00222094E9|nr:coatomer protein alpha subunit [Radiomyces spectabilis]KAI8377703.1 coatomer protein alpha subunit [Radiomyces spectabilis]
MQMLTKFESKSNRVKGIAFHPKRPWILASLHNGCIQLWDYRMGTLLERFDEHDGPVRGIAFHPTQPLFASGGDDYKIKVWNYKTRRCLFTLSGHLDYVRTVFFHHENPWIISASDDQTIRIWNWQSRTCIAILTGHNHYVMCAQFHPKNDLVVSASMDQTVRVWDITGLRKKNQAPTSMAFEDPFSRQSPQADLFGSTDVMVKYVLEGHDHGVNWASFHPTLPLIVSAGDDRQVKLWRMSDTRAWEVDSCRGHFNNVSNAIFHPRQELILSDGEDKSIRVWDMTKRTAVATFRRDHDRFWVLTAHPELNLFAAGHDSGLIVFKLERERPAFQVHQQQLYYVKDKIIHVHDFASTADQEVLSVRKLGSQYIQPRTLSYNPAERAVLLTSPHEGGIYELYHLPKNLSGSLKEPADEAKRGTGQSALFIARNRFAVFDKVNQQIEIRDLSNTVTKSFKTPTQVNEIFYAGTGNLILSSANSVILFDIQQRRIVNELPVAAVKYVVWSADYGMVALLSKHSITLADKNLTQMCQIHETIRIKSGVWDNSGVFLYSTLNHIKYALPQGDNGIIRTLEQPVYLASVKGKTLYILDRDGQARSITIDPTEYRFKLALIKRQYEEVLHIIRNSNLVGQSIIAYLQKKGYPEIALHFVRDDRTRFELALECGNLDIAVETAKKMDKYDCWSKLSTEALRQGNYKIVELAYQRTKNYDRLSFLYLTTGNETNLRQMMKIAELRQDPMSRFQNALYLNDAEERVRVLQDVGQMPLAYLTAKTHGLQEQADAILAAVGKTEDEVELPSVSERLPSPMTPKVQLEDPNWPLLTVSKSYFEGAFALAEQNPTEAAAAPSFLYNDQMDAAEEAGGAWGVDDDDLDIPGINNKHALQPDADALEAEPGLEADEEGAGWDVDDDDDIRAHIDSEISRAAAQETAEFVAPTPGTSETAAWIQNSPLAADHIAAGSYDTAMQTLNRQVGVVNFEPLKPYFLSISQASCVYLSSMPSNPTLPFYLRRQPEDSNPRTSLPVTVHNFQHIVSNQLQLGYKLFSDGRLAASATQFKHVLHSILFTVVANKVEADEVEQLIGICKEYIMGLAIETKRRATAGTEPESLKRALELAAYFTHSQLQVPHLRLALRQAMKQAFRLRNFSTATHFARRLLELAPPQKAADEARQIQSVCERNLRDEIELEYDQYNPFVVCGITFEPIYKGSPQVNCPFCQASYKPEMSGKLCTVCEVAQIGANGSGLRVML